MGEFYFSFALHTDIDIANIEHLPYIWHRSTLYYKIKYKYASAFFSTSIVLT